VQVALRENTERGLKPKEDVMYLGFLLAVLILVNVEKCIYLAHIKQN
jgi:hypothetical protein